MKIKAITNYKGRFCAELENGNFVLSNGSMELLLCEKVESGMKVIKADIVAGIMMRTEEDFKWAVEHM
jgi:IMP cyclohydrolase